MPAVHGEASPPRLVTLHVWGVPTRRVPWAASRMLTDRLRLRATPGLAFGKLLGTGHGRSFTPRDADPRHWALLAVWDDPDAADAFDRAGIGADWAEHAEERWRLRLRPLRSRGRWSGRVPFDAAVAPDADGSAGPVAVVTRARLAVRHAATFWRAVPPVAAELAGAAGLLTAFGFGEAPVGWQGTFSLWSDSAAVAAFAYRSAAHRHAVQRTGELRWYVEELFARFAVSSADGTYRGANPVAGRGMP